MKQIQIVKYCHIYNNCLSVDGKELFSVNRETDFREFSKSLYKHLEIKYPKFYKMDMLSRLGFLAAEALIGKDRDFGVINRGKIGILLQNSHSSQDADELYFDTIKDDKNYFPGPAQFVYTLPNIMIGEICIRFGIKGENSLFIVENFNSRNLASYSAYLLNTGLADCLLCGYIDFYPGIYKAFLYIAENVDKTAKIVKYDHEYLSYIYNSRIELS